MKKILSFALALALCAGLAAPAFAAGGTAYASTQSVEVDGKKVEFQMYALRDAAGNGTNYVKLRDVAHVLNGTPAQFSVGYDSASGSILVTTGAAYADTGTEMTTPYSGDRTYQTGSGAVLVDGKAAGLDAIVLTDDAGGGYTYFKLRDLGTALGFTVDWSAQRGVTVSTGGGTAPAGTTKDVEVTTKTTTYGTGYYVADNGFGDGYLNNGKPITEENVLELLKEAEKIWPTGMTWTNSGTYGNNWYQSSGNVVDYIILSQGKTSSNYACGGFAAMISDYLFGKSNNPARRVTDLSKIRPGDIICAMDTNGKSIHVMISASSTITSGNAAGRVYTADENSNATVNWPHQYSTPDSEALTQMGYPGSYWLVYTRYPA